MADLRELAAREIRRRIAAREVSAEEVATAALDRARHAASPLGAFLHLDGDEVRAAAHAIDERLARGEDPGPLAGVPVAIKDNIAVRGTPLTCASRILEGYRVPYDATVVRRLRDAGAVLFGKTNLDEFAMGSSGETSAFGATRNPWNLDRVPGGSSSGSAAAVAARCVPLALGSDTGGSIRQPAAFCGVLGLKPTYGRVSRYGLVAYGSSLEQVGPIARSADDARLLLAVLAGRDSRDATTIDPAPIDAAPPRDLGLTGIRLGIPREHGGTGVDPEILEVLRETAEAFTTLGATVEEVSLPHASLAIAAYYVIVTAEASANLARFDGIRYGRREGEEEGLEALVTRSRRAGFGPEVRRRILLGTYGLSAGTREAYFDKALRARTLLRRDLEDVFRRVDVLLSPTSPFPAFPLGSRIGDPLQMVLCDVFTVLANLCGIPALSFPAGFTSERLPIGLQLQGPAFGEERLLRLAAAFETVSTAHRASPPLPPRDPGTGEPPAGGG